jgi:hypothetical protein
MTKKTKKNTIRNNNRLTRYGGGDNSNKNYKSVPMTVKAVKTLASPVTATAGLVGKVAKAVVKRPAELVQEGATKINKAVSLSKETQDSFRNAGESLDDFKKNKGELLNKGSAIIGAVSNSVVGEIEGTANYIGDKSSIAVEKISDGTKEALTKLEKVTQTVGIDRGSVGNFMATDETCKFDIPSVSTGQIENKTENDVNSKLSKSKLFGGDEKFKKYMQERIIKKCREYHDVTKKEPNEYFMRFYNHCANFFDCFNDVTELVYLFNDVIKNDLSFLKDIKNEKNEKDKKKEIDMKVEENQKLLNNFTKEQEEKMELEKRIGESEEETKKRQADEKNKKGDMEKYIKAKEKKKEELEQNKLNLGKQIKNLIPIYNKLKKESEQSTPPDFTEFKKTNTKLELDTETYKIHAKIINEVLESNYKQVQSIKTNIRGRELKLRNDIDKIINDKVLPSIKNKIEKELNDIYSEYQKALNNKENKKNPELIKKLKSEAEKFKLEKFLIKYSYADAEESNLMKEPTKFTDFIKTIKAILENKSFEAGTFDEYIKPKPKPEPKPEPKPDPKSKKIPYKHNPEEDPFILNSELYEDKVDKGKSSSPEDNKDTKTLAPEIVKIQEEIKKLEGDIQMDSTKRKEDLKKLKTELKVLNKGFADSSKSSDTATLDSKINILVFFLNNVFISNVKEYAIINSAKDFTFKDDLSRELSKIIEYNKYREQIEKLDRDKEFKEKVAKIGDTNFIDNNMFETIKIEKRGNVEKPAFDMNELYKKLKNNKDIKQNISDYYTMLMKLEMDMDSGKIKMDKKFEEDKFGPNMYMYIVLGFLGTALGFELANLKNVRAAMGNG